VLARAEHSSLCNGVSNDVNGTAPTPPSDLASTLEDVPAQFESYKVEMGVDAGQLREDLARLQRQLGQAIDAAYAKATAKIEYLDSKSSLVRLSSGSICFRATADSSRAAGRAKSGSG
jgi:nucleoprotein TPR